MSSGADLRYRNAGDVGVFRTASVDGVAHEDRDLEIDTPTNGGSHIGFDLSVQE